MNTNGQQAKDCAHSGHTAFKTYSESQPPNKDQSTAEQHYKSASDYRELIYPKPFSVYEASSTKRHSLIWGFI